MKKYIVALVLFLAQSGWAESGLPDSSCPNQTSKVLSDICIDCFFPLRMGIQIGGGGSGALPDDKSSPICICPAPFPIFFRIGIVGGGWLPEGILEATPREWCSSTMGGTIYGDDPENRGVGSWSDGEGGTPFWNVHYIKFPLGMIASMLTGFACSIPMNAITVPAMWSELDPSWNDPELAALKNPEGLPPEVGMAALILGCAAEWVTMQVNDGFYGTRWCAGTGGQTYPLSGYTIHSGNFALMSAHASTRLLDGMYRVGMQRKTWGTQDQICNGNGEYKVAIPKNGHRFQQVAPKAENGNHRIGDDWAAGETSAFNVPGLRVQGHEIGNNNFIYINWKYYECCVL